MATNGLVPLEEIAYVSSRLVVGKAAMKMKHRQIQPIIEQLAAAVEARKSEDK